MTAPPPLIPQGSVVITPDRMYDEIRATHELAKEIRSAIDPMAATAADHETRIRALERKVWLAAGLAAGAAAGLVEALSRVLGG